MDISNNANVILYLYLESIYLCADFTLASLAKKYLKIRLEKFPTAAKEARIIQQLLPALAATQEWTAEKLLRLAPSVQFLQLLDAIGVGDEYVTHRRPIAPEILKGGAGCPGCIACGKKKRKKKGEPKEPKKPRERPPKEGVGPKSKAWLSSTDSDSD